MLSRGKEVQASVSDEVYVGWRRGIARDDDQGTCDVIDAVAVLGERGLPCAVFEDPARRGERE